MNRQISRRNPLTSAGALASLAAAVAICACAPLAPMPFALIDKAQVYHGTLSESDQRIEVTIAGKRFQGFYLLASGTGYVDSGWWRRGHGLDKRTSFVSNSARATMAAADGERLSCEFIAEAGSAIGECRSTLGQVYQLVTATP